MKTRDYVIDNKTWLPENPLVEIMPRRAKMPSVRRMPFPCPFQGHELNHRDRKEWAENGGKQNAGGERETKISLQNKRKG